MSATALNPEVIDGQAIFKLATGEKIRVSLVEGGLGLMGYSLNINTDKALLVIPSSGNSVNVMTKQSLFAQEAECKRIVQERDHGKR